MSILKCQICDHECDPQTSFSASEEAQLWVTHTVDLVGGYVRVLTCPECSLMTSPELLEGYQLRIREGRDRRYH